MSLKKTIAADVLATLKMGEFTNDVYTLPRQRFSRERYEQLAAVINDAGGKWCRKAKGFTFKAGTEALKRALSTGETLNVQQATQFFPTPPDVARKMADYVTMAPDTKRILEPSAGHGALVKATWARLRDYGISEVQFVLVEKDEDNFNYLAKDDWYNAEARSGLAANLMKADFLQMQLPARGFEFDAVVMNPPFSRGDDIKHILRAWDFLKVGGMLVALCANGPKQNRMLKPWALSLGGTWEVLPSGTFKDSGDKGTNIETVLLTAYA